MFGLSAKQAQIVISLGFCFRLSQALRFHPAMSKEGGGAASSLARFQGEQRGQKVLCSNLYILFENQSEQSTNRLGMEI